MVSFPKISMPNISIPKFTMPNVREMSPKDWLVDPWPFVTTWVVAGLLAILIPLRQWNNNKMEYYALYGYAVEYEQAQRDYEDAQNGDDDGNNNNNQNDEDYEYWYYYPQCSWWNFACRKRQFYYAQNNNNDSGDDDIQVPNWYLFIGGTTEEQRKDDEENGDTGTTGVLKLAYAWTLIMFLAIMVYGAFALSKGHDARGLILTLFIFAQFALMTLLLMGQGVIQTDGREMEDSVYGWYGQTSVLMVYQNFWMILYSLLFGVALTVRLLWQRRQQQKNLSNNESSQRVVDEESSSAYQKYDEPKIAVTDAQLS